MKRFLIFSAIGVAIITALVLTVLYVRLKHTKQFSPEDEVYYADADLKIKVFYNRPYKKNRIIFGGLVPYGDVWRTGANEATTFESNKPLKIDGKDLAAGKYTLWTVPDSVTWQVIFNSEYGQWGVDHNGKANRDPDRDVLTVLVHAVGQDREFEQFTITFEKKMDDEAEMVLLWDKTVVAIPFSY